MKDRENNVLLDKVREKVSLIIENLNHDVATARNVQQIQLELNEMDDIEGVLSIDFNKITTILSQIDSTFSLSREDFDRNVFFFRSGEKIPSFKTSERYLEAKDFIDTIFARIKEFKDREFSSSTIEELEAKNSDLANFMNSINSTSIEGEAKNMSYYDFVFDETWSEEEKLEFYTMLLKGHISHLRKKENIVKNEKHEQIEAEINVNAEQVEELVESTISERKNQTLSDPSETVDENLPLFTLSDEINERLDERRKVVEEYRRSFVRILRNSSRVEEFKNSFKLYIEGMDLDDIKASYSETDFKQFLAFCIREDFFDIKATIADTYSKDDLEFENAIVTEALDKTEPILKSLKDIEKKENEESKKIEEIQDNDFDESLEGRKIFFYRINNENTMLEKNIKGFDKERLKDLGKLLELLENGVIKSNKPLAKSIPYNFKWLAVGNTFITFRMLSDDTVFVYSTGQIQDIQKKSTTDSLAAYDISQEKELLQAINESKNMGEETISYKKLSSANQQTLNELKTQIDKEKQR